jgi:hypothetical protein
MIVKLANDETEYIAKYLEVHAYVNNDQWGITLVDDTSDIDGKLIPCRNGSSWCPIIDLDTATIINWNDGVEAYIGYKIGDRGVYVFKDAYNKVIVEITNEYVPDILCPAGICYGDQIKMHISKKGVIHNWDFKKNYYITQCN